MCTRLDKHSPPDRGRAAPTRGSVLLAEDDEAVRHLTALYLEWMGFRVVEARDGIEALERFREHAAELRLALLNLNMPRLDWVQVLAELHGLMPGLPAILMSGSVGLRQRYVLAVAAALEKAAEASQAPGA